MLWLFFEAGESHKFSLGIAYTNTVHRLLGHIGAEYVWLRGYMNFTSHALVPTPTFLPPTPHYRICSHHGRSWYTKGPQPTRNSEDNEGPRQRQDEHHQIDIQDVSSAMHVGHVDGDEGSRKEEEDAGAGYTSASASERITIR